MNDRVAYCTIAAANYLSQTVALYESVQATSPGVPLYTLVVDLEQISLPPVPEGMTIVGLDSIIPDSTERHNMAAIYDVVELSTALKPRLLEELLATHEQVVYLDPDMWLVTPLEELEALIDQHGVVLTPHFLESIPPGERFLPDGQPVIVSEVHCLTVGFHNLGFCAVGRGGLPFLQWWWDRLCRECLIYPLFGMFVDQKWTDVGGRLFGAHTLRHYGYNIANHNLHERRFVATENGLRMETSGEPVRLLHFSGFDPHKPEQISDRQTVMLADSGLAFDAFDAISLDYAASVLRADSQLGELPEYGYARDCTGAALSKRLRRTYRSELLAGAALPSPFAAEDRKAFVRWRRRSVGKQLGGAALDAAMAFKYAFPDTFGRIKAADPRRFRAIRSRLLDRGRVRR
jgi:hypothetical protein